MEILKYVYVQLHCKYNKSTEIIVLYIDITCYMNEFDLYIQQCAHPMAVIASIFINKLSDTIFEYYHQLHIR